MKFQSASSFEKHLEASSLGSLSSLFLLVSTCPYEKKLWSRLIIQAFTKKDPTLHVTSFHAPTTPLSTLLEEIQTPNLWNALKIILIQDIDQMKPSFSYDSLKPFLSQQIVLIFTASSSKGLLQWYQQEKKEMVVLDTSEEKPWDKEKRVHEWIALELKKIGKTLSSEGISFLIQLLGTDTATLDQELKKITAYVGDHTLIKIEDIKAIVSSKDLSTGWTLAEELVWQKPISLKSKVKDTSFIFPFLGQVRYQLQTGLRLTELLSSSIPQSQIKDYFPSIRPFQLDKLIPLALKKNRAFFLKGILELYKMEVLLKTTSLPLESCFDYFQAALYEKIAP
ncbi:DNA polymerase III subunit delta [Rhabdochlamydiaceae symbiont of Dictyostelium giganteum]|uniref:DNA polymerase III subunit delta n=1 Tax=Rhabdochlamydiaceae symbiont of Dictyostelium giganteum TaxID=3342349 RepID=UPI00384DC98B